MNVNKKQNKKKKQKGAHKRDLNNLYQVIYYGDSQVEVGKPFSISCIISIANPVEWHKDGEPIRKHSNIRHGKDEHSYIESEMGIAGNRDKIEASISVQRALPKHQGRYQCNALYKNYHQLYVYRNGTLLGHGAGAAAVAVPGPSRGRDEMQVLLSTVKSTLVAPLQQPIEHHHFTTAVALAPGPPIVDEELPREHERDRESPKGGHSPHHHRQQAGQGHRHHTASGGLAGEKQPDHSSPAMGKDDSKRFVSQKTTTIDQNGLLEQTRVEDLDRDFAPVLHNTDHRGASPMMGKGSKKQHSSAGRVHVPCVLGRPAAVAAASAAVSSSSEKGGQVNSSKNTRAEGDVLLPNYDQASTSLKIFDIAKALTLGCNITQEGNFELSWAKDGKNVSEVESLKDRFKILAAERKFVISRALETDAGQYTCSVPQLGVSKSFNVVGKHTVTEIGKTNIVEGERLTLHCIAYGTDPKITWTVGNNTYNASTDHIVLEEDERGVENAKLIIDSIKLDDYADYTCEARNNATEFTGKPAQVLITVRVRGKYAALYVFLGIIVEVVLLCAIILICEKRRNKTEIEESDTDQSPDQNKNGYHGNESELRQRK
ncbi:AGAP008408-PA [Anopheles gambiae str. PEST]|uniref:AGAP008408-PA n=1 Tax=Anopheles gambiae TaxID=7165 RepID=Q7Q4I1_ANOGA|nr:AGAP008408-PA [Anopheles gambiae str. PEST]